MFTLEDIGNFIDQNTPDFNSIMSTLTSEIDKRRDSFKKAWDASLISRQIQEPESISGKFIGGNPNKVYSRNEAADEIRQQKNDYLYEKQLYHLLGDIMKNDNLKSLFDGNDIRDTGWITDDPFTRAVANSRLAKSTRKYEGSTDGYNAINNYITYGDRDDEGKLNIHLVYPANGDGWTTNKSKRLQYTGDLALTKRSLAEIIKGVQDTEFEIKNNQLQVTKKSVPTMVDRNTGEWNPDDRHGFAVGAYQITPDAMIDLVNYLQRESGVDMKTILNMKFDERMQDKLFSLILTHKRKNVRAMLDSNDARTYGTQRLQAASDFANEFAAVQNNNGEGNYEGQNARYYIQDLYDDLDELRRLWNLYSY